jgi:PilZ domain
MPKVKDSIARRLYGLLVNHIQIRRSEMRLPVTVSLLDLGRNPVVAHHPPVMPGFLRDISKTGLSLVVPSVSFGDRFLTDGYCEMRIMVELPDGAVNIQAVPVRYDKFDEPQNECAYLVGARILRMADPDRESLARYIKQVKRSSAGIPQTSFALARDYSESSS